MTFKEDRRYRDAVKRIWVVHRIVETPKGERVLLLKYDRPLTGIYEIAIDNGDGTATVLEKEGFTTIYDESEIDWDDLRYQQAETNQCCNNCINSY